VDRVVEDHLFHERHFDLLADTAFPLDRMATPQTSTTVRERVGGPKSPSRVASGYRDG
jgi:hypothetical protein